MTASGSIFWDFNLPNATTWFYFSFLLATALFFKFSRLISIRNWDVVTLFLLVPGMLLIQQARRTHEEPANVKQHVATLVGSGAGQFGSAVPLAAGHTAWWGQESAELAAGRSHLLWFGYLWLLCGSACFLGRCLVDLVLESRPAIAPNLNLGGLAWLAGALFLCLAAVAYRPDRLDQNSSLLAQDTFDEAAALTQESSAWNLANSALDFWLRRTLAMLCHLAVVAGLIVIGARHYRDAAAGMAAAAFYLMLPYTGLHFGEAHHVWPMALVVWAVVFYRVPTVAGIFLGIATVTAYFPLLIVPVWLGFYWRRGSGRFAVAYLFTTALGLGMVAGIRWQIGDLSAHIDAALSLSAWQPWKAPTTEGIWTGVHWAYRIPLFIGYAAFVLVTTFWPCPKNLAHTLALSAAVLIGLQFWYADQGGVYVLWYLPLYLLMVFRPKLSERRPPITKPEHDWLLRIAGWVGNRVGHISWLPRLPARSLLPAATPPARR